jgi:hypothetical protein
MADNLITSSIITAETLRILHNESAFLGNINREYNSPRPAPRPVPRSTFAARCSSRFAPAQPPTSRT